MFVTDRDEFSITAAERAHIVSLASIAARAFHPVNSFIKNALPDTPAMRQWFSQAFLREIENRDNGRLIVARENATNEVVGILALRLMGAGEKGSGMWTKDLSISPEQEAMYNEMVNSMTESRERFMLGVPHCFIQLFGVDHEYKGHGLGTDMLKQACRIADEVDYPIFVQSNKFAKDLYAIYGFVEEAVVKMAQDPDYTEHMMIRPSASYRKQY